MRAVVVGSGPNGLAAALTLVRAGLSVHVIEAADKLGGGVRSAELTLPGLTHDTCSGFHPFGPLSQFAREFDLEGAGLTWRWATVDLAHPLDDGRGAVLERSVEATAAALGPEGSAWRRMFERVSSDFAEISAEFLQPMLHLPRHPLALARFGVLSAMPAAALARGLNGEPARALFGGVAAHAMRPFEAPFSAAIGVALTAAAHHSGWPVAEGGSRSISDAIAGLATSAGATFETGRMIRNWRELDADIVMLDTTPSAAADIVGPDLPAHVRRAYRRYRHGPAVAKVDFAVEQGIPWSYAPARGAGTVHLGGTLQEMTHTERQVARGKLPERPFVLVGQQFLADATRSCGDVHPVYAYAHVPSGYPGTLEEGIIAQIERFAPGFRDRIVASHSRSAPQAERENVNYVGGDVVTGANTAAQLILRPRPSLDPYSTGVRGVYLCSAATPPGAGAHGMCGHLAAKSALAALDSDR